MTDVLKVGKKVFTLSVVVTTILWSVGVAAFLPLVANADVALTAGDVIKGASTKNVFYYAADGKRYTFPSDKVFFSYFKDYTVVKTLPDSQLGAITIGGTLPYRAGTQLVKIQTDPKVYAVEPAGKLRWVETEAVAKALYGNDWAKRVHDVDPAIFPYVYSIQSNSVNTATFPAGSLVKSGSDVYYIVDASHKQKVTSAGMTANRLFDKNVLTTTLDLSGYATGADLTAADSSVSAVVAGTAPSSTPTAPAGSGIAVSLSATQPLAATIVASDTSGNGAQGMIDVLKLSFAAPADGDVTVKTINLKKVGISAVTDISNMYLYDGATKLASNPVITSTNNQVSFSSSAGLFTVTKGTSKDVTFKLDLKDATASGKTLAFVVNAATDITLASGSVSGSFPLTGNTFTTAQVSDLGKLTFTNVTPTAAGTVDPGQTNFEIWRFQAANTNQDVEIRKLVFTIVGSVASTDLTNFTLWDGATQIGSAVASMASDKTVAFNLSPVFVVTKGQTKILSLKCDIVAGTNRTFRASLQSASDIVTFDKGYNIFLKSNSTDSFSVIQPVTGTTAVDYTINVGTLTQTLASDSPVNNIPKGATNVTLAKFKWKANGEDVKVSSLSVSSTANPVTDKLANVRLLVDGSQVGTTITSLTMSGAANTGFGTFGNSFIIKAGTTAAVTVVADLTDATIGGAETITVGLPAGSTNAQGTVSLTSLSTVAQTANTLTVQTGTVTAAKNQSFGDKTAGNPTGTVNASTAKVASLVITAGAGEAVDVSQITLKDNDSTTCIGDKIQNLLLKNAAGTQLGATYPNPTASASGACTAHTYTFNITPAVTIGAGAQLVVDVFGDLKAALSTATALVQVDAVTATGHNTGTSASLSSGAAVALQNVYIASAGNLMVQVDADSPVANNYLLGATDQTIAKIKLTASSTEALNISQFVVSAIFPTDATTGTFQNIKLYDNDTGLQIGSAVSAFSSNATTATTTFAGAAGSANSSTSFAHAIFTDAQFTVAKGLSKVLVVKADVATYEGLNYSSTGQVIAPVILRSYYGSTGHSPVTVTGASSGSSITPYVSTAGNSFTNAYTTAPAAYAASTTMYRCKLTTAWATDTPSGASSPSSAQVVAKFVVTNLANAGGYTATVSYANFALSTTISQAAGGSASTRALTVYKDALSTTAVATSNYSLTNMGSDFDTSKFTSWTSTVDISSGAAKTFYVTLDTTDAASTKSLSVRINSAGIVWTDGVSTGITAMGTDLPLIYKTFTY